MKIFQTVGRSIEPSVPMVGGLWIVVSTWWLWGFRSITCISLPTTKWVFGLHLAAGLLGLMPIFFVRWVVMVYLRRPHSLAYFATNSLLLIAIASTATGLWGFCQML